MQPECIPINAIPGATALYKALVGEGAQLDAAAKSLLRECYPTAATGDAWLGNSKTKKLSAEHRAKLADLLEQQNAAWGADAAVMANITRLREGADAVVSGQQVVLFGGPLLTLLKAATAVQLAQKATEAGKPHVPIFWLASEDHDFAEVSHVSLLEKNSVETLSVTENAADAAVPVGRRLLGEAVTAALEQAKFLLGHAPVCELLDAAYQPGASFADAFAKFLQGVFAGQGLILIDAATREFHALGAETLRGAITHAAELQAEIGKRSKALEAAGFHAQVTAVENGSLLFLIDEKSGARNALRRVDAGWRAGTENYSTEDLLKILETAPERLSPNALLRPVFQDTLLPTTAYIGGPAEMAYFAQSQVAYAKLLGQTTPVLPRLSATLVENAIAHIMDRYGLTLHEVMTTQAELGQRLGARAMPVEGKRKLAAAGNALDGELTALTEWMKTLDENLGRSAEVAANKMRYQMNRLRQMAANFEVQKENSLAKHSAQMVLHLYPQQTLQERVVGGAFFVARYGDGLAQLLVEQAGDVCGGHKVILL